MACHRRGNRPLYRDFDTCCGVMAGQSTPEQVCRHLIITSYCRSGRCRNSDCRVPYFLVWGIDFALRLPGEEKYARTEKQIRTYRILTAAACIIAVVPTLFNSFYWQLMMDYFFVPFFLYLVLIVVAVIINCINTFTNRIWDEQPTTEFIEKQQ